MKERTAGEPQTLFRMGVLPLSTFYRLYCLFLWQHPNHELHPPQTRAKVRPVTGNLNTVVSLSGPVNVRTKSGSCRSNSSSLIMFLHALCYILWLILFYGIHGKMGIQIKFTRNFMEKHERLGSCLATGSRNLVLTNQPTWEAALNAPVVTHLLNSWEHSEYSQTSTSTKAAGVMCFFLRKS